LETSTVPILVPGVKLGRYELLRNLAVGGMAELFVARASGLEGFEKLVVLKRILPQLATNADFIKMFLDEARIAALLHHPNIAQVYDFGRAGESYFFTMEYVPGKDLREILRAAKRRGGIPLEHALGIILGVAAGLHYAHERVGIDGEPLGIVHRDVSPANVLVTRDGGVKLVDFGVAKARSRQTETRAGTLKGKIAYMSPEQCKGEEVDRRSDVFALGILLYELSTGTRLFKGDNEFAILREIATQDVPPPSSRTADYPPELEAIVLRALKREPAERYPTAEELQVELEAFVTRHRLVVSPVGLRRFLAELFPQAEAPLLLPPSRAPSASQSRKPATVVLEADEPDGAGIAWDHASPAAELPMPAKRWSVLRSRRVLVAMALLALLGLGLASRGGGDHAAKPAEPAREIRPPVVAAPVEPARERIVPDAAVMVLVAVPEPAAAPESTPSRPRRARRPVPAPTPPSVGPVAPLWDPDSPFLPAATPGRAGP
jgi:serine/threonine protein kinase